MWYPWDTTLSPTGLLLSEVLLYIKTFPGNNTLSEWRTLQFIGQVGHTIYYYYEELEVDSPKDELQLICPDLPPLPTPKQNKRRRLKLRGIKWPANAHDYPLYAPFYE